MAAPDGEVVGLDGRPQRLARFTRERITLLGFIYTTCVDPHGCPLAYRVFDTVRDAVAAAPTLRDRVRLVTLSFDPARDTPAAMRGYAGSRARRRRAVALPHDAVRARADAAGRGLRPGRALHARPQRRRPAPRAGPRAEGLPRRPRGLRPRDLLVDLPAPADRAQRHRDARPRRTRALSRVYPGAAPCVAT